MTTYNRVILTGRVAKPPQRRYRPDGSPVIQFPLELDEVKDLPGREQPQGKRRPALNRTGSGSLIQIVAFGKLAEFELDFFQSGQHLLVEGQLKQRHWQTPEGKNRTRTEVIATDLRRVEEESK
jgi:single stranded DNA-binding protein